MGKSNFGKEVRLASIPIIPICEMPTIVPKLIPIHLFIIYSSNYAFGGSLGATDVIAMGACSILIVCAGAA